MIYTFDTSCLVPLLSEWHEHHLDTLAIYRERRQAGDELILVGHAVLECFSTLTRFPPPYRVDVRDAAEVMRLSFKGLRRVEASVACVEAAIQRCVDLGRGGGLVYDAVIAQAALEGGAKEIVCWNARHFKSVAPEGLRVVSPV